jgi:hypothetical protein
MKVSACATWSKGMNAQLGDETILVDLPSVGTIG